MRNKIFLLLALLVAPLQETVVAKKSSGIPKGVKIAGCVAGLVVGGALLTRHLLKKPTDYVPEDSDIYSPEELEAMKEAQGRSYGNLIGAGIAGAIGVGFGASLAFGGDSDDDDGMKSRTGDDLVKKALGVTEKQIEGMSEDERESLFLSLENRGISYGKFVLFHARDARESGSEFGVNRGKFKVLAGNVDVKEVMADPANKGAVFMVASERNMLPGRHRYGVCKTGHGRSFSSCRRMGRMYGGQELHVSIAAPATYIAKKYLVGPVDLLEDLELTGEDLHDREATSEESDDDEEEEEEEELYFESDSDSDDDEEEERFGLDEMKKSWRGIKAAYFQNATVSFGRNGRPAPSGQVVDLVNVSALSKIEIDSIVGEENTHGAYSGALDLLGQSYLNVVNYSIESFGNKMDRNSGEVFAGRNKIFFVLLGTGNHGHSIPLSIRAMQRAVRYACDRGHEVVLLYPTKDVVGDKGSLRRKFIKDKKKHAKNLPMESAYRNLMNVFVDGNEVMSSLDTKFTKVENSRRWDQYVEWVDFPSR